MHYEFQAASNIDAYLKAIDGANEFIVKRDAVNGIIIINYVFSCPTTFPDPCALTGKDHRMAVLRRDCRGLKFDLETGDVVAKPYHKFFNVNQLPETQIGAIDWQQPHVILEKLDGSMVHPHRRKDGVIEWHTKMGPTLVADPVNAFVKAHPEYEALAHYCIDRNLTVIFEWCSRQQRIVLDYPQEMLILTAIRDNHTGQYMPYE